MYSKIVNYFELWLNLWLNMKLHAPFLNELVSYSAYDCIRPRGRLLWYPLGHVQLLLTQLERKDKDISWFLSSLHATCPWRWLVMMQSLLTKKKTAAATCTDDIGDPFMYTNFILLVSTLIIKALKCKTLGADSTHAHTLCNNIISAFYVDDHLPTYIWLLKPVGNGRQSCTWQL